MQLNQFKSLQIGDRIFAGNVPEHVENQFIRVIDGKPVSYITTSDGLDFPETFAGIFELGPHTKTFENRSKERARNEQQTLRELNAIQRRDYPESVPRKFIEMSEDEFMGEYEKPVGTYQHRVHRDPSNMF
jgi:hypothetical protein